jgi:translation initiation factor IF-2
LSNNHSDNKLRVYEYAKQLNMSSKEIITILKRVDIPVNNHMSVMEPKMVDAVEKFFRDIKANAAAKRAAEMSGTSKAAEGKRSDKPEERSASRTGGSEANRPSRQPAASISAETVNPKASEQTAPTASAAPTAAAATDAVKANPAPQSAPRTEQREQPAADSQQRNPQEQRSGDRPRSDRPYSDRGPRPQGDRPYGDRGPRPQGDRPYGDRGPRPQGDRPYSGSPRPQGDRPQGDRGPRPQGDRPYGDRGPRPQGDRPYSGSPRPQGDRPYGDRGPRPQGDRPYSGSPRPQGDRPQGDRGPRPQGDRPYADRGPRPQGDRPYGDRGPRPQGDRGPRPQGDNRSAQGGRGPRQGSGGGGINKQLQQLLQQQPTQVQETRTLPKKDADFRKGKPFDEEELAKGKGKRKPFDKNQARGRGRQAEPAKKIDNTPKKIIVRGNMTVGELAKGLHKDASEVIKKLLFLGIMATINQELDLDAIQLIADDYKVEVDLKLPVEEDNFETVEEKDDEADLEERPPVVTIMGHVDHGKTTLLDAIRSASVVEGEAGGITQHIGAYQVEIKGKKITFLDTPGHEAFTHMRARGAQVTDITILVVAADDGVMPQTVEAINHAKAANVPIIVAVNKIDKPTANPDRVKQELTEHGLVPEEWGGDTIFCNVSAKARMNLEELLEMILLVAEVQEFKANPNKRARGTVMEAELDKGKGPVARILIQHGTLNVGDAFVAGVCFGRVRAMVNDKGRKLKEAGPSTPVEITGLTEVPQAGDPFIVFEDERKARNIAERRATTLRQSEMSANSRVTLDDLYKHIKEGEMKELNVIIKGDVQGSVEALKGSLEKIEIEGVRIKIIHTGAGAITESDVSLASASNAIIIGFNVRPEPQAKTAAEQEKVDIRMHRVIYQAIDEIEAAMKGLLDPVFKEKVIGQAEVRNVFKISKIGSVAGCMVTNGKIQRNAEARLIRQGIVVFEGKLDSLKRFKDDAKEVAQGYECGITLDNYNDLKEGDIIEAFVMETVER